MNPKPHDGPKLHPMSAAEIVALHANDDRHPKAIAYEIRRASVDTLVSLAYGEHADQPLDGVPADLAAAAYDETERRRGALSRLLADNPLIAAALAQSVKA